MKSDRKFPIVKESKGITAKIYATPHNKGYDLFTLVYYLDRERKRETFADLTEAQKRAGEVLESLSRGEISATGIKSQDVTAFYRAQELLRPTGFSLESACKEFAEAHRILDGVSLPDAVRDYVRRRGATIANKTVQEVVQEFLNDKTEGKRTSRRQRKIKKVSEKYLDNMTTRLLKFAESFHCNIGTLDAGAISEFLLSLPHGGRTKNNYLQSINALFSFAEWKRYLARDSEIVQEVALFEEEDFDIEIFKPDEMSKLLESAPEDLIIPLAIGGFAGLRSSEIARLEWPHIKHNAAGGHIEVKAKIAKTASRRIVPMSENLAAWLGPRMRSAGKVWVHSPQYMFELQSEAATEAEVCWRHNALRHSFISYRLALVQNMAQVALEAGNSETMITKHYRELVSADDAKKWFAIMPTAAENVLPFRAALERPLVR